MTRTGGHGVQHSVNDRWPGLGEGDERMGAAARGEVGVVRASSGVGALAGRPEEGAPPPPVEENLGLRRLSAGGSHNPHETLARARIENMGTSGT